MNASNLARVVAVGLFATSASVLAQTPPSLGLKLWLKADAISGLNHGDKVTSWPDSSGSGNPATNSAVANQPTYLANALNGLPVVHFNDSANGTPPAANAGQWLDSTVSVNANNANFTAIAVFKAQPTGGLRDTVLQPLDDGANNGRTVLWVEPVSGVTSSGGRYVMQTFASGLGVAAAGEYAVNSWTIATALQDTVDDRLSLFRNGQLAGSRSLTGAFATPNGIWRIGDMKPRTGGLNGDVAEVLIYDRALTAGERSSINSYLSTKYGIPVATAILTDTFDTPDNFDLTADLETRQSGAASPSSGYYSSQSGLSDVVEVKNNKLSLTASDTSGAAPFFLYASPGDALGSFVVNNRFAYSVDISAKAANDPTPVDSWAAIKVASANPLQGPAGVDGFGVFIRSSGGIGAFDGMSFMAGSGVVPAPRYTVCTAIEDNLVSCSVNGTLIPLTSANGLFATLTNGVAANYVSFACLSGSATDTPFVGTFDNFTFATFPEVQLPATVILADNYNTADTTDLDSDLASRQTGVLAPASYSTAVNNGASVSIEGGQMKVTHPDNVLSVGMFWPAVDFLPYERSQSFRLRFKVTMNASSADTWSAIKIREPDPAGAGVSGGEGFGLLLRPSGGWQAFQGSTSIALGGVASASIYAFEIEALANVLRAKINGEVILSHTMPVTASPNHVTLMSFASTALGGPTGAGASFDDFEFAALGQAILPPAPELFDAARTEGTSTFKFNSFNGVVYIVEFKDNLNAPSWETLGNAVGTGGVVTVSDSAGSEAQRFYRLRVP